MAGNSKVHQAEEELRMATRPWWGQNTELSGKTYAERQKLTRPYKDALIQYDLEKIRKETNKPNFSYSDLKEEYKNTLSEMGLQKD